jgi:hypothetical protein
MIAGIVVGLVFALSVSEPFLTNPNFKLSEVHIGCAGIIGTALALILSLSIIPAQKAAEAFSSAILRLYAQDRTLIFVFGLLSTTALVSLLLGTNWAYGAGARYAVAAQLVILGLSLDALRGFYRRALKLLIPGTALTLVLQKCTGLIDRTCREAQTLVRLPRVAGSSKPDPVVVKAAYYLKSHVTTALTTWIEQLTEFAHKGLARRDTQAVKGVLNAMAAIGTKYADSRRDSLVILPNPTAPLSEGRSDISDVLGPIHDAIRTICEDAITLLNENVAGHCMQILGAMAGTAMGIVHGEDGRRKAPLAHAPIFYLDLCAQKAGQAKMEDALLGAIDAAGSVFQHIKADVDTRTAESQAIECLTHIASSAYGNLAPISSSKSVEMMLWAAHCDVAVRGFRVPSMLKTILERIVHVVPLEQIMVQTGRRMESEGFAPYSLLFGANLPALLERLAGQVKPVDPEQEWINPFREFDEASKIIVMHYRRLAERVTLDSGLLLNSVLDSVIELAEVHLRLLDRPLEGTERFLNTVDDRLTWYIYTPPTFFGSQAVFPEREADDICRRLAVLGMGLLERGRLESAKACGSAIHSIAGRYAASPRVEPYALADLFQDRRGQLAALHRGNPNAREPIGRGTGAARKRYPNAR